MSTESIEVKVLHKNHQWMVQEEPRGRFIVQVLECDPEDTEGGYWIRAKDLKCAGSHSVIRHVCEKTWVDMAAFEDAVKAAISLFSIDPDYDVDEEFAQARRDKNPVFTINMISEMPK